MTTDVASGAHAAPLAGSTSPIRRQAGRLAPLVPGLLLLALLFVIPMIFMLTFSFWRTDTNFDLVPAWNLDNYARFFNVPTYFRTFAKTLGMAAVVTVAGIATAMPFAYFLVPRPGREFCMQDNRCGEPSVK